MAVQGIAGDPKVRRFARKLSTPPGVAVGILVTFWQWSYNYRRDGGVTYTDIEDALDSAGFLSLFDAGDIFAAMRQTAFLDDLGGGVYYIHDLHEHAPDFVHRWLIRTCRRFADGSLPNMAVSGVYKDEREKAAEAYKSPADKKPNPKHSPADSRMDSPKHGPTESPATVEGTVQGPHGKRREGKRSEGRGSEEKGREEKRSEGRGGEGCCESGGTREGRARAVGAGACEADAGGRGVEAGSEVGSSFSGSSGPEGSGEDPPKRVRKPKLPKVGEGRRQTGPDGVVETVVVGTFVGSVEELLGTESSPRGREFEEGEHVPAVGEPADSETDRLRREQMARMRAGGQA